MDPLIAALVVLAIACGLLVAGLWIALTHGRKMLVAHARTIRAGNGLVAKWFEQMRADYQEALTRDRAAGEVERNMLHKRLLDEMQLNLQLRERIAANAAAKLPGHEAEPQRVTSIRGIVGQIPEADTVNGDAVHHALR